MMVCLQNGLCQPQRATQDVSINQHAFIRVHVHPKRFPAVYTVDWKVRMHPHFPSCPKHCRGLSVFCVNKLPASTSAESICDSNMLGHTACRIVGGSKCRLICNTRCCLRHAIMPVPLHPVHCCHTHRASLKQIILIASLAISP